MEDSRRCRGYGNRTEEQGQDEIIMAGHSLSCHQFGCHPGSSHNQQKSSNGLNNGDISHITGHIAQTTQFHMLANTKGNQHKGDLGKMIQFMAHHINRDKTQSRRPEQQACQNKTGHGWQPDQLGKLGDQKPGCKQDSYAEGGFIYHLQGLLVKGR